MNEWDKAVVAFHEKRKLPVCPSCKKGELIAYVHKHGNRDSLTLQCKDCKAFAHYD